MRLLLLSVAVFSLSRLFFSPHKSTGQSMEPWFEDGETFFVNSLSYSINEPKRYDVIVFWDDERSEKVLKRIIGLPEEVITINDGKIYINGKLQQDVFGVGVVGGRGHLDFGPIRIPENSYFVIGDNRIDTFSGVIKRGDITGKVILQ